MDRDTKFFRHLALNSPGDGFEQIYLSARQPPTSGFWFSLSTNQQQLSTNKNGSATPYTWFGLHKRPLQPCGSG
ncbi:hypothetical protein GCM10007868_25950 [Gluconobacter frateurii]|uniref:Uncharacterized protein n=1 Tax=Gluconobacter frateurii NRIC 0228 TaxID=1307946 RepID=A0ABQ0QA64_9PROT|nr:hypothetical protein AA0228_1110 [Gluconobacter frateurii NRIC 0228]GLP91520.1 hypothetical protein GCM10007868_25950 [Gluconobacter frateurii]